MSQSKSPRFMSLVRSKIRVMQYSYQTEKTYVYWIKHFIHFNNLQHPKDMGPSEVTDFLTYLAVHKKVSPATQNQALCALVYMYKHVLEIPLGECGSGKVPQELACRSICRRN